MPRIAGSIAALGPALEPDFLLLAADRSGDYRLQGGALCFPTGWALEEKTGLTVDSIHRVVSGLNTALGSAVALGGCPGAWLRANPWRA